MSFWVEYGPVIAFYVIVIALIYFYRSKFEFQGKVIAMLRNNWGVDWMNKTGKKHAKLFRVLGDIGIFMGYAGMALIMVMIVKGFWDLFANPAAPPTVAPVLPGVPIAGTGLTVPLLEGIIALFLVIVVHESAHGLVAAAHGLKVKSSGFVLLGPIPGAFVEPDEKKMEKVSVRKQLAIFAAGPWSNMIQAALFLGLFIAFSWFAVGVADPAGFTVGHLTEDGPAAIAGVPVDEPIVMLDGEEVTSVSGLITALEGKSPGDTLTLGTASSSYDVTLGEQPDDPGTPLVGVNALHTVFALEQANPFAFWLLRFIINILQWTYILALGLGLANLLPLGPVDGGRMFRHAAHKALGKERGDVLWTKTAVVLLIVLLVLLIVPIARAIFL